MMHDRQDTATNPRQAVVAPTCDIEDPNLAERLVAHIGAWAVAMTERLNPPSGPFFHSDGRLLADASLYTPSGEQSCCP